MKLITFLKSKENLITLSFIIGSILLICILYCDSIFNIDIAKGGRDSTINYLSDVGVGALAGILAFVISITMVAVQFTSQQYSSRIMQYYTKSFIFWSLAITYIFTICFNIVILNYMIPIDQKGPIDTNMIDASIILTMLCFILVILHFLVTVRQLQPAYIIKQLLDQVDRKSLKRFQTKWKTGRFLPPQEKDRVLAVTDIIKKSIESKDRLITNKGLVEMFGCYNRLITSNNNTMKLHSIGASALEDNPIKDVILNELQKVFKEDFSVICFIEKNVDKYVVEIEEKIYLIKKEDNNLNFYDNLVPVYFTKHFLDVAEIAIINSNDYAVTKILDIFEKMMPRDLKGKAYGGPTAYPLSDALYQIANEAINQKLMNESKIAIIKKFVEIVTTLRESEKSKLKALGEKISEQKGIELATIEVLRGLRKFESDRGLLTVGKKTAQNGQVHATREAIEKLIELKNIDKAIEIILEATRHKLEMHSAGEKIGKLMAAEYVKSKSTIDIKVLEDNYCKYSMQNNDPYKVILEMNSCIVKTIMNCSDNEIQSYCEQTHENMNQRRRELPVCTITFSYLDEVIKQSIGKEVELNSVVWNGNMLPTLTFVPKGIPIKRHAK